MSKEFTGYIDRIGIDSPAENDIVVLDDTENDPFEPFDQFQDKALGVDETRYLVAGAMYGIQFEQAAEAIKWSNKPYNVASFEPLNESYLMNNDKPLNIYGPMNVHSSIILADIENYDHKAGIFQTLVWQVPTCALPDEEYYLGYFSTNTEEVEEDDDIVLRRQLAVEVPPEITVFWKIIKIIVRKHDTAAHFSVPVDRLYS